MLHLCDTVVSGFIPVDAFRTGLRLETAIVRHASKPSHRLVGDGPAFFVGVIARQADTMKSQRTKAASTAKAEARLAAARQTLTEAAALEKGAKHEAKLAKHKIKEARKAHKQLRGLAKLATRKRKAVGKIVKRCERALEKLQAKSKSKTKAKAEAE